MSRNFSFQPNCKQCKRKYEKKKREEALNNTCPYFATCKFIKIIVDHLSTSPRTISTLPRIAIISATICPLQSSSIIARFTKDGPLTFTRKGLDRKSTRLNSSHSQIS